ncbi:MAG: protein-export chaperone SecB [Sphingomonadales bacterium]|nr:protein-export chaperone SecB [Sphingomonadales bacterium]MBD3772932.1 protein-export chaperone SecB [Paracoccaceae bacterium]
MADEGDVLTDLNLDPAAGANGADNQPVAGIISQYIKDMSVENPNAPASYQWQSQSAIDLQFNIAANPVNEEIHEITLKVNVTAKCDEGNLYLIELAYGGLVGMRNLPEDASHHFLYAEAPRLLFPFARRVIADAVRDAGYPPMMIDPIDFNGIYLQQIQQRQAEQGGDMAPVGNA